jgi:hypothetical protein
MSGPAKTEIDPVELEPITPAAGRAGDAGLRLGEAIELPWWAPLAMLPPFLTLLGGLFLRAPVETRVTDVAVSALMVYVVVKVGTRVRSRSLQSVYISGAYAFWFFLALIWLVSALPPHLLR